MGRSKPSADAKSPRRRQSAAELAPKIVALLPARAAEIARALGRKPSDGTVRRALAGLVESGAVEKAAGGVFERCQELATLPTPEGFDDVAVKLHAELLEACQLQGTWREHDVHLLDDLVRRDQDARRFREAVDRSEPFTESSTGRVYAHPGIDKERDARRDVQTFRAELVLTPNARKHHGRDGDDDPDSGDEFEL